MPAQIRPGVNGSDAPLGLYGAAWASFYRAEYSNGQGDSSVNYYDIGLIRVVPLAGSPLPYSSYLGYKHDCGTKVSALARRSHAPVRM